jgi:hypothetical protein
LKRLFTKAFTETRRRGSPAEGTALIEASLLLPLVMLLMLNAMNFGLYIFGSVTVDNAARAAAQYQVYNGIAIGFSGVPPFGSVNNLVTADVTSLHNRATVALTVCKNNGTVTCAGAGSYTPPPDNEAVYTLYSADVSYTYTPFISAFSIPALGISLTPPATIIHRQVVMRSMQ